MSTRPYRLVILGCDEAWVDAVAASGWTRALTEVVQLPGAVEFAREVAAEGDPAARRAHVVVAFLADERSRDDAGLHAGAGGGAGAAARRAPAHPHRRRRPGDPPAGGPAPQRDVVGRGRGGGRPRAAAAPRPDRGGPPAVPLLPAQRDECARAPAAHAPERARLRRVPRPLQRAAGRRLPAPASTSSCPTRRSSCSSRARPPSARPGSSTRSRTRSRTASRCSRCRCPRHAGRTSSRRSTRRSGTA